MITPLLPLAAALTSSAPAPLALALAFAPVLVDYELPGHPSTVGRGHIGATVRGTVRWFAHPRLDVEFGVLGRLPFALDLEDEAGALPIFAIDVRPFGEGVRLRFGSLQADHGYHAAIVDEDRYGYGRDLQDTYNKSIVPEAHRDLGGDPFLPGEHGAQLLVNAGMLRAETFVDWQLLESRTHREKFNFGVLGELRSRWADFGLQLRVTHYGGQLFTRDDPIRVAQLDPVRQPETLGAAVTGHPFTSEMFAVDIPLAFVAGNMIQTPGGREAWHYGLEAGVELVVLGAIRAGYLVWLPKDASAGFVSEDSDPVYQEGRAHRARLGLSQDFGNITLDGRLDLVFSEDAPGKVQYLAVTRLVFRWQTAW